MFSRYATVVGKTSTATSDHQAAGVASGNHGPSWAIYGLGSETRQLPAFISMNLLTSGMQHPQAAGWGSGFLPTRFQGTVVDSTGGIRDVKMPDNVTPQRRRDELAAIRSLNQRFLDSVSQFIQFHW